VRGLPGRYFDHRLHFYENFRAALCRQRSAGTRRGWSLWKTAIILVVATGIYTIAGGLAAVIYTDTVQTLILIAGACALTFIGLHRVGGLEHLRTMVPDSYFHMIKPASDPNFPWTGIFFGAPILGIWYWCTDQVIVQRVLSARDEGHAKAGTIFAGFLKILPVFMLVLPGIIAFALYPDQVVKPDFAYPTLVLNPLPTGLVGLVMAALLAAVMGAMSSVFNCLNACDAGFLQEAASAGIGRAVGEFRTYRYRIHGCPWPAVGAIHSPNQQPTLHLPAKRASLHQSADRLVLRAWNSVDTPERHGRNLVANDRIRARSVPLRRRTDGGAGN
jgi:hypothetical protein